jgi:hypothetical protein
VKNGSETDVDCGGGACEPCGAFKSCLMDSDCATKVCDPTMHVCVGCGDGKKDGAETDVDCGGPLCSGCGLGQMCMVSSDCVSHLCQAGKCVFNHCTDGRKDFDETDVDCGGADCPPCHPNAMCTTNTDCATGVCGNGYCALGKLGSQYFYSVMVMGFMTDTNVTAACKAAGWGTPCQSMGMCQYDDNTCEMTAEMACGNPMMGLAAAICNGQMPPQCNLLNGVYQYMGHHWQNDSACGVENGQWCAQGSMFMNRFALCVSP